MSLRDTMQAELRFKERLLPCGTRQDGPYTKVGEHGSAVFRIASPLPKSCGNTIGHLPRLRTLTTIWRFLTEFASRHCL